MHQLPNEVLINIFQRLPQHHLLILSTICKKWKYIITQPLFYNTLDIYSHKQLKKYIEIGKEKPLHSHLPLGYSVNHLQFYTSDLVCSLDLVDMIDTFPNLHSIQGLFTISESDKHHIYRLHHLKHIPFWYQNNSNRWMYMIHKYPHQIVSLECTFTDELLIKNVNEQTPQSPLPIIYFPFIKEHEIEIQRTINEIFINDIYFCDIFNISLPILPCLTHLSIDYYKSGGSDLLFETIHQSCPQLNSLHLKPFHMFMHNNYSNNHIELQPNLQLKELSIGEFFHDSKCFDYLSMKYPRLESFNFTFKIGSLAGINSPSMKPAIYNLITQYKHLKKLIVKLENVEFLFKIWPYTELLHWLKQKPLQLTYLEYNYNFIDSIIRQHGNQLNTDITPTLSSTFFNDDIFLQSHDYLNHLSTLSIVMDLRISVHILYYFYLCNDDSSILSNSIELLKIDIHMFGNVQFWLHAFPNLKSLSVIGKDKMTAINDDDGDDELYNYENNIGNRNHLKKSNQFLKKKMNWRQQQQQSTTDSTAIIDHHHYHSNCFKLKKLELKNCAVDFKRYGWNGFFKLFNNLNTIILININLICNDHQPIKSPFQQATFDLSHLSLNLIKIENVKCFYYFISSNPILSADCCLVKKLMIKELLFNNTYYIGHGSEYRNSTFDHKNSDILNIICKSIDNVVFNH
ncbi:unnamed protein product [Cunninghamella blakesleeana]